MASPMMELDGNPNSMPAGFYSHPKCEEMMTLGITDHAQIRLTFLTYLDLVENKGWWNVCVRASQTEGVGAFLVGHASRRACQEVVLPISGDAANTVAQMQRLSLVCREAVPDAKGILLAIVDSDSSISYFRLADGLVPPAPPEEIEAKVARQKRLTLTKKQRFTRFKREAQADHVESASNTTCKKARIEVNSELREKPLNSEAKDKILKKFEEVKAERASTSQNEHKEKSGRKTRVWYSTLDHFINYGKDCTKLKSEELKNEVGTQESNRSTPVNEGGNVVKAFGENTEEEKEEEEEEEEEEERRLLEQAESVEYADEEDMQDDDNDDDDDDNDYDDEFADEI